MPVNSTAPGIVRKPRPIVSLNGTILSGVIEAEVTNASHFQADTYRVTLAAQVNPPSYWSTGAFDQITISVGLENQPALPLITGYVDDIDWDMTGRTITLSGRDLSGQLIDAKTAEKFLNQTSSQIAQTLALRHGLSSAVFQTDTKAGTYYNIDHTVLTQEQTEWDLLIFLATQEGFDVWVAGTTLYFQPSPVPTSEPYLILWSNDPIPVSNATRIRCGRSETLGKDITVVVKSFNQQGQQSVQGIARATKAKSLRSGKAQLYTFRFPNLTRDQAQQRAESLLADITRHEMVIDASLPGDNLLTTRRLIRLADTGTAWDQLYYPDQVTRRISTQDGYRMEVRAKNHSTQATE